MKRNYLILPLLGATLLLGSCVSKQQFADLQTNDQNLQTDYQSLQSQNSDLQVRLAERNTQVKSLEERLAEARKLNEEQRKAYTELQKSLDNSIQLNSQGNINISKLVDEINASNKYIKQLVDAKTMVVSTIKI